ncbi:MAG: uracil phosphoribosyltransferase [Firmicutes bacterium]|uniref:Uracil phosphoribosyltransferase n=1 Tax=Candidatus Scybalomonas excrementavium TaxID=2840943 RepID=A0A9D9N7V3_9FIRM|nr:uracil phosphoribosyltransferase [Candidatus Scybalomonas excrementavium]
MRQQVTIMEHPLIQHKITRMRKTETSTKEFRELVSEVSMLICYEATKNLPLTEVEIETPLTKMKAVELSGKKLCVVPILRAGLHMADSILHLIPNARIGHIGMYRDEETLQPVEYLCKLPTDIKERVVYVVDPMLATGGSAISAINQLKQRGITNLTFLCLIAAPEGVEAFTKAHPDVPVYIGALDSHLNEHGYIVPGLGDAGDRIYGTN